MTRAMIPAHPQPPGCCRGPMQEFPRRCLTQCRIQIQMRQADSNRAVAPRRQGCGASELAQVTPVLLLLVKERVLESECCLRQLLVLCAAGCAREMGQGPADASCAVGKAAHSFRRFVTGPAGLPVPTF